MKTVTLYPGVILTENNGAYTIGLEIELGGGHALTYFDLAKDTIPGLQDAINTTCAKLMQNPPVDHPATISSMQYEMERLRSAVDVKQKTIDAMNVNHTAQEKRIKELLVQVKDLQEQLAKKQSGGFFGWFGKR